MKILDPGSVVREGEFANAQNAGGIDTKIRNLYNQVIDGTRLSPDQRQDFLNQSKNAALAEFKGAREALDQRYKGLAANSGLRVDQIIPSNYLQIEEELSPSKPQEPGIDTKQGTYRIPGLSVRLSNGTVQNIQRTPRSRFYGRGVRRLQMKNPLFRFSSR